jgi:hypothetical protein
MMGRRKQNFGARKQGFSPAIFYRRRPVARPLSRHGQRHGRWRWAPSAVSAGGAFLFSALRGPRMEHLLGPRFFSPCCGARYLSPRDGAICARRLSFLGTSRAQWGSRFGANAESNRALSPKGDCSCSVPAPRLPSGPACPTMTSSRPPIRAMLSRRFLSASQPSPRWRGTGRPRRWLKLSPSAWSSTLERSGFVIMR